MHTLGGYRGLIPAETILEERRSERVTEDGRKGEGRGEGGNRSRLTRWTHYHSSIWGTFSRSDQWLSIPCNGIRSDIRHRGTRARAVITGALPSPPGSRSLCCNAGNVSRTTQGSVFARRGSYPTTWKDRAVIDAGEQRRKIDAERRWEGGGENGKGGQGRERERDIERRSALVVRNVAPGLNEFH